MRTLSFGQWIANATAGLMGSYGAITEQAKQTGCSRQCVYDHTQKVVEPSQPNTAAGRPSRKRSRRTKPFAGRTPNCGTGYSR
jgi:hypothetical protein